MGLDLLSGAFLGQEDARVAEWSYRSRDLTRCDDLQVAGLAKVAVVERERIPGVVAEVQSMTCGSSVEHCRMGQAHPSSRRRSGLGLGERAGSHTGVQLIAAEIVWGCIVLVDGVPTVHCCGVMAAAGARQGQHPSHLPPSVAWQIWGDHPSVNPPTLATPRIFFDASLAVALWRHKGPGNIARLARRSVLNASEAARDEPGLFRGMSWDCRPSSAVG